MSKKIYFKRPFGERRKKETVIEKRLNKYKELSMKEIESELRGDPIRRDILIGLGIESSRGTAMGDLLRKMAKNEKIEIHSKAASNLLSILRVQGIIEKTIKGAGIDIKIKDKVRLKACAELDRIIQKDEWEQMKKDYEKKLKGR